MLSPDDTQRLLEAGSARALADAAAVLRRCVSPDGSVDGSEADFTAAEIQWATLLDWARASQKILPLDFPAPEREGGREHDVTLHESSGRWIKHTKPAASGYTVSWRDDGTPFLHNALPLDYVQRLLWQNEIFGDDIHLIGLWSSSPHQPRIVTTQPGLAGTRATLDDLSGAFRAAGFELLPWRGIGYEGSLALRFEGFDIWDVHPANVLLSPEGLPLPLDVIVTRSPAGS
jgi:hypothetical protein